MKFIKQLFWIFLFSLLGEGISLLIVQFVSIPGSVIGMVLLFVALHFNLLAMEAVDELGTWLTDNMALFFVPAGVGLMPHFDLLADYWLELSFILVVSLIFLMVFVGKIIEKMMDKSSPKNKNKKGIRVNE